METVIALLIIGHIKFYDMGGVENRNVHNETLLNVFILTDISRYSLRGVFEYLFTFFSKSFYFILFHLSIFIS